MGLAGIELFLNGGGIGASGDQGRTMSGPVLQKHGNGRRAAAFLALLYERDIQPDARRLRRRFRKVRKHEKRQQQSGQDVKHDFLSPLRAGSAQNGDQGNDKNGDDDDNQQVAIGEAARTARREIALRLPGALGQLGQIIIAQLPDGLINPGVVDVRGFQGLLRLLGGKELPQRGFVSATRFERPGGVFVQFVSRYDVLFLRRLATRRAWHRAEQQGYR